MYRDQVERLPNDAKQAKRELKEWLKAHIISYIFVGDEFIPNPDAKFTS